MLPVGKFQRPLPSEHYLFTISINRKRFRSNKLKNHLLMFDSQLINLI